MSDDVGSHALRQSKGNPIANVKPVIVGTILAPMHQAGSGAEFQFDKPLNKDGYIARIVLDAWSDGTVTWRRSR